MFIASLLAWTAYFYLINRVISLFSLLMASSLVLALRTIVLNDFFDSVSYFSMSLIWVEYISLAFECLSELRNCSILPSWTKRYNFGMNETIVEFLVNYFWDPCSEFARTILFRNEDWLKDRFRVVKSGSGMKWQDNKDKL